MYQETELLTDFNDYITQDISMTSLVQNILEAEDDELGYDYKFVEKILDYVYSSNDKKFSDNKYNYLMRLLPIVLKDQHKGRIPECYFRFFNTVDKELVDNGEELFKG